MKKIIIVFSLFAFVSVYGQGATCGDIATHIVPQKMDSGQHLFDFSNARAQSVSMVSGVSNVSKFYNNGKRNATADGGTFLYDDWNNSGAVYTAKGKFIFENLNYDLNTGKLLIKTNDNQIFSFTTAKIKSIEMNNDKYKVVYDTSKSIYQLYQVLFQERDFEILKGYKLVFKKASPHESFNMGKKNMVSKRESIYLNDGVNLERVKMSKRKVLSLIENKNSLALRNLISKNTKGRVIAAYKN